MKHGTSVHIIEHAIDKELGLADSGKDGSTGGVMFDALWVTPLGGLRDGLP